MLQQTPCRAARFAGSWYPADAARLGDLIDAAVPQTVPAPHARAVIVPHAGLTYSGALIGAGLAGIADEAWRRVVILSPSHYRALPPDSLTVSHHASLATPLGALTVAPLPDADPWRADDEAMDLEHGVEMFLPFLARLCPKTAVSPVLVGSIASPAALEGLVDRLLEGLGADGDHCLVIASSDMSHYGPRFDHQPWGPMTSRVRRQVLERDRAMLTLLATPDAAGAWAARSTLGPTMCGHGPAVLAAALATRQGWRGRILAQADSAGATGQLDPDLVSYAALAWEAAGEAP